MAAITCPADATQATLRSDALVQLDPAFTTKQPITCRQLREGCGPTKPATPCRPTASSGSELGAAGGVAQRTTTGGVRCDAAAARRCVPATRPRPSPARVVPQSCECPSTAPP